MMTNDRKKDRQEIRNVNQCTELMYDALKARWLALSQRQELTVKDQDKAINKPKLKETMFGKINYVDFITGRHNKLKVAINGDSPSFKSVTPCYWTCFDSGYIRLLLVFISLLFYNNVHWFLGFYIVSVVLDAFDGIVARQLNQTSIFGAWFDVVIDLISRGALWCFLSPWGYFIMLIEWMTFVATHTRGANWKIPDEEFPWICKKVMANGFKTPTGTYAITGIFVLPLWLYGIQSKFLTNSIGMPLLVQYLLCVFLVGGRFLALVTEIFFIWQHIKGMLVEETKSKEVKANVSR